VCPGENKTSVCGSEVSRVQEIVIVKAQKVIKKRTRTETKRTHPERKNKIRGLLVFDHRPIDEDIDGAIDPCR